MQTNTVFNLAKICWTPFVHHLKQTSKTAFSSKYLLVTNVTISTTLSGVGDVLQQQYEIMTNTSDKPLIWDKLRTRNMCATGTVIGVVCHYWYLYLDKTLPGRTLSIVAKKLIVDQIAFSPFLIAVFFGTLGVLEKTPPSEVWDEMKHKAWKLYAAEWIVWPPAQIINFYLLPTRFRVLYDNTISLGYDVYTSYIKHET